MNNPVLSIQSTPPSTDVRQAGKKANASQSEGSFGQMLSREIGERRQSDNSGVQESARAARAEKKSPAAPGKAEKATDNRHPKTESRKPEQDEKVDATSTESSAVNDPAAASAEIMAMIARAAQGASTSAQTQAAAESDVANATGFEATDTVIRNSGIDLAARGETTVGDIRLDKKGIDAAVSLTEDSDHSAAEKERQFKADIQQAGVADIEVAGDAEARPASEALGSSASKGFETALQGVTNGLVSMQSASQANAAQSAASVADRLSPRVGTPAWDNALSQKVVWMVGGEHQSATLTLNPPDLGPLQVVLNVSNSMASATFTAAQPEVRQAIENAMPKLREMLGDAGIQLGQSSVNSGNPGQNSEAHEAGSGRHQGGSARTSSATEDLPPTAPAGRVLTGRGLVDTFV
ncbi:MAG: putative flagellar hook-length control protein FliK [Paucimonas sp.]|nr:putative flagellar hook-length control protein FliK [Paucimonas sp.]